MKVQLASLLFFVSIANATPTSANTPSLPMAAKDSSHDTESRADPAISVGVELHLGAATPVGFGGVMLSGSFRNFKLVAGVGANTDGIQVAFAGRIMPTEWLDIGPTFSIGAHSNSGIAGSILDLAAGDYGHWDSAKWIGGEVGVYVYKRRNIFLRAYVGAATILNRDDVEINTCTSTSPLHFCGPQEYTTTLPYGGLALGIQFN